MPPHRTLGDQFMTLAFRRMLTGIPFTVNPGRPEQAEACTESVIRLALELKRLARGDVAFAVVGEVTTGSETDCAMVDQVCNSMEDEVAAWLAAASPEGTEYEVGAWCGTPSEEWTLAARSSEMDLLIVPGTVQGQALPAHPVDWPGRADCSVWFVGQETDALATEPPLILLVDDFTDAAEAALRAAITLAQAWSARLLVGHCSTGEEPPTPQTAEEHRRTAFARLSRNDFRCIAQGANFVSHHGDFEGLLTLVREAQAPNLVIWPVTGEEYFEGEALGTAHLLLWHVNPS